MRSIKVYYVIGVSASGKSTIAGLLAQKLGLPYFDADDFHPQANIDKMSRGESLQDEDRWPWLRAINHKAQVESKKAAVVITCSALKEVYRKELAAGFEADAISWIVLNGSFELLLSRINERAGHFMPPALLQSQFDVWEKPTYGIHLDVARPTDELIKTILKENNTMKSDFGLIGLGVMGKSLSRNLANNGVKMSLYNRHVPGKEEDIALQFVKEHNELTTAKGFDNLENFVQSLSTPRKIMLMVNAGAAVDAVLSELEPLIAPGDVIIDGGNSHYKDTERRTHLLAEKGIDYIGSGVSGGEEGALKGPSIMPGGSEQAYRKVAPYLERIAAVDKTGGACCAYIGKGGAGHFVKMVHNGIEYAEMQLIAEVYMLLRYAKNLSPDAIADIFEEWCRGDLDSYLLEISHKILRQKENDHYLIDLILDKAGNKGTGSWTTIAAAELGVPITMITSALFARYVSAFKTERVAASDFYKSKPDTTTDLNVEELKQAYRLARLINHHQGIHLIDAASQEYKWELNLPSIARIWTNGCIIRSGLMLDLIRLLGEGSRILLSDFSKEIVTRNHGGLSAIVAQAHTVKLPIPCLSAASDFINSYLQAQGSANVIQAQRDFFGAHTYKRVEDPDGPSHHTIWPT